MVEVGPRSMPTKVTRDSHNVQKVTDRAHPKGNIPRAAIFRGSSPGGVLQSHLPPHRSESQRRDRSGASVPSTRAQTHHRQGGDSHRAMGKLPQYPGQARVTVTTIKAQIKGISAQTSGPTSPRKVRTPQQEELGSCSLHKRDHKHKKIGQNDRTKKYVVEEGAK